MSITANWSYPTLVKMGAGRIKELADHCKSLGMKKPLLVTDRGLSTMRSRSRRSTFWKPAASVARSSPMSIRTRTRKPEAGVKAFKDGGHDGVVAFGGGSGLDLGKCVAFMAGRLGPSGISRMSATGGPALPLRALLPSSPCRRRPAPARKSAAPRLSPIR